MFNRQTWTIDDARLTDRDAILVRTDLPPGQLRVSPPISGNFTHVRQIPSLGLSVRRGWCAVDVFLRGQNFRYICTHLEQETSPQLQVLQVQEILHGPANVDLPVILCGDFNSDPFRRDGSAGYSPIVLAGFNDAWAVLHPANPTGGLTWGHDEGLANPNVPFDRRIDFVFFRGAGIVPVQANVADLGLNRTQPPLWASDHAAVFAGFQIQQAPFAQSVATMTPASASP
jgi:endonuclease/exonuclease/phosphatase family metal-dependent hydrolase